MHYIMEEEYDKYVVQQIAKLRHLMQEYIDKDGTLYDIAKGTCLAYHTVDGIMKGKGIPSMRTYCRIVLYLLYNG